MTRSQRPIALITGGAGFIGANVAARLLELGDDVLLLDDLSRPGVEANVGWLSERYGDRVRLRIADVRDPVALRESVGVADRVFHFAAQVAVTQSLESPLHDLGVNAMGTLSLLEALRALPDPPPLIFTSTNKVYGALEDLELERRGLRYEPRDPEVRAHGISEQRPLDFHSPYGCSKGAADQYVLDYARTYGLRTTVFRMSCIYGPRQFGTEEQGWVAHFLGAARRGEPLTIYGDGLQVRDVLYVDDLVDAFLLASAHEDEVRGRAFNVGGGPENTLSLLELLEAMRATFGLTPEVRFAETRPGDQRYYVSDVRELSEVTGFRPKTSVREGLLGLFRWLEPEPFGFSAQVAGGGGMRPS
jgi:CDP-paratose 2-epimerase